MKRYLKSLIIVCIISLVGCSDGEDNSSSFETINVQGKEYAMPPVIQNTTLLREQLNRMSDKVLMSKNTNIINFDVTVNKTNSLFSKLFYVYTYAGKELVGINLKYTFKDEAILNDELRKEIANYFQTKCELSHK